jgi:hypothetical protein
VSKYIDFLFFFSYLLIVGLLTKEQLDDVWDSKGLKHRYARLHDFMVSMGLGPMAVRKDLFLKDMQSILYKFFKDGLTEDKDGRQNYTNKAGENEG